MFVGIFMIISAVCFSHISYKWNYIKVCSMVLKNNTDMKTEAKEPELQDSHPYFAVLGVSFHLTKTFHLSFKKATVKLGF